MMHHFAHEDDVLVPARTVPALANPLEEFVREIRDSGLEINVRKSMYR